MSRIKKLVFTQLVTLIAIILLTPCLAQARGFDDVPSWLRQAAATNKPQFAKNVSAVVLYKERRVVIDNDGKATTTEQAAIKVLTPDGAKEAATYVAYLTQTGKVRDMRAWLLRANGEVKRYGKDETVDQAAALNDVYNETRIKYISASSNAEEGAIFGYEWSTEEKAFVNQDKWFFQDDLPVVVSRYVLTLPTGWRADSVTFNHNKVEPNINGNIYTWELRDLSPIEQEDSGPSISSLSPGLAISYFPPSSSKTGASFTDWVDVSRWLTQLSDGQALPDPAIKAKAQSLIANAKTEYEKIRSIGEYVQKVQYISIQTNVGRGGGYKPHPASEVFAKSYGDCKDKANLMKAMLKAVDIPAYLLVIYSGDPTYVRSEWPSPQQFNHCIIAINTKEETKTNATVSHPTLGNLLIFDPTDDVTAVGDLPDHEQNSLALLVAGEAGALLKMPVTSPEANLLARVSDLTLTPEGAISGTITEESLGQAATRARAELKYLSKADYQKMIEKLFTKDTPQAKITKIEPLDNTAERSFKLSIEFNAPNFGQSAQNRLLVFKPLVATRHQVIAFNQPNRKQPIVFKTKAYKETVRVKLPEKFVVDEIPDPVKLTTSFGYYQSNYEVKDGNLFVQRILTLKASQLNPDQYSSVRKFFEQIHNSEQSPVVLLKK